MGKPDKDSDAENTQTRLSGLLSSSRAAMSEGQVFEKESFLWWAHVGRREERSRQTLDGLPSRLEVSRTQQED